MKKLPRALLLGATLAAATLGGTVVARDVFAPPPPPPPFLRGLGHLDLSDSQRQQIGAFLDADRDANEKLHDSAREAREAFVSMVPGSGGYQGAAEKFADAEAKAVRARILGEAQLRAKVYAALTEAQRLELAALPKPRGHDMDGEFHHGHHFHEEHGFDPDPRGAGMDGPAHGPDGARADMPPVPPPGR